MSAPRPEPQIATSVSERTAEQLRHMIVEGEFSPGQRLSEQAFSARLNVSRNTLREVFRLLTQDGLLRHEANRGVFVAEPSMSAVIDIYRVRRLIECQALAQAHPVHPARRRMREAVERSIKAREERDWRAVGTANMDFHTAVVALADSERLNKVFDRLLAELRLAFGLLQDPEFLHAPYVDRNLEMLERVEAGDFKGAAAAMEAYLTHSERIVLAVYARRLSAGV